MSVTVAGLVSKEAWMCVCETPILKRKDNQGTVDTQQWDHCAQLNPSNSKKEPS